jgi:chorismate mutase
MEPINFPIERINNFLKNYNFTIESPYYEEEVINYKIKLTGTRKLIVVGDWHDVVEYTLYLESAGGVSTKILSHVFESIGGNEKTLTTTDTTLYQVISRVNNNLYNLLNYFNIENHIFCNKVVNDLKNEINESFITEGRYDNIVRKVVKDIMSVVKYQKEGEFSLPEDIGDEMMYSTPKLNNPFTIELNLEVNEDVDTIDVDGEYYPDEDIISITIISNPNLDREILEELHFELNELIRHEIEHISQMDRGEEFPEDEPKKSLDYYTQRHELEAQIAGFKRRAQKERKPIEDVIRRWFTKNYSKHNLSPKDVEIVINRILELS